MSDSSAQREHFLYREILLAYDGDWVEHGRAPEDLTVVEQQAALPIVVDRSLPLCRWPALPHYKAGDSRSAASFVCAP
jgi:hypothetical protein